MLSALDEAGAEATLRKDGEDIMAVVADRHGGQRYRLGWTRAQLEHEYQILHDLIDSYLRRHAAHRVAGDLDTALAVVHRLLDDGERASLTAFERCEAESRRSRPRAEPVTAAGHRGKDWS